VTTTASVAQVARTSPIFATVKLDESLVPFDDTVPYRPLAEHLHLTSATRPSARRRATNMVARMFGPHAVAGLGSLYLTAREGTPCGVRFDDGLWIHSYPEGVVVDTKVRARSAADLDTTARDVFLAHHVPGPGETVVDVGAGNGSVARLFSSLVGPSGRVVAVEAHPTTFRCLRRTVELNELFNVDIVEAAVVGVPGPVLLHDDAADHRITATDGFADIALAVAGRRLGEILDSLGVGRVNLLKMNIEGSELSALAGAADWLSQVDNLVVSCHDFRANGDDRMRTFAPVAALLREAGFQLRTRPNDTRPPIPYYLYASRAA
jgi:FkbM family methyltransferase